MSLVADVPGKQDFASHLDALLNDEGSLQRMAATTVLDSRTADDAAIVIVAAEGPQYRLGIDIDPFCLVRTSGEWKIAPEVTQFPAPADADQKSKAQSAEQLHDWYRKRKQELHDERRKSRQVGRLSTWLQSPIAAI